MELMEQQDWIYNIEKEEEEMEAITEYHSALGKAIAMWQEGHHIPMDLYTKLIEDGFDVPRLEARYFIY